MAANDPDYGVRSLNGSMLDTRPLSSAGHELDDTISPSPSTAILSSTVTPYSELSSSTLATCPLPRGQEDDPDNSTLSSSQTLTPGPFFRADPFDRSPGPNRRGEVLNMTSSSSAAATSTDNPQLGDTESEMGMGMIMPDGSEFSPGNSSADIEGTDGWGRKILAGQEHGHGTTPRALMMGLQEAEGAGTAGYGEFRASVAHPYVPEPDDSDPFSFPTSSTALTNHPPSLSYPPSSMSTSPYPTNISTTSSSAASSDGSFSMSGSMTMTDFEILSNTHSRSSSPREFEMSDSEEGERSASGSGSRSGERSVSRLEGGGEREGLGAPSAQHVGSTGVERTLNTRPLPVPRSGESDATPGDREHGRSGTIIPRLSLSSTPRVPRTSSTSGSGGIGLASANGSVLLPLRPLPDVPSLLSPPLPNLPSASSSSTSSSASRSGPDSFQPPTRTRQYAYSRSHWAVEEARRRSEEQGDDLTLEIPELPDGLLLDAAGNGRKRTRPQHFLLCGTNRTTNALLKALMEDGRVQVYALPVKDRAGKSGGSGRRKKDGSYRVGVFAATADISEAESDEAGQKARMLVEIHVIGKGQLGNVQRAVAIVEATYGRLDRLLSKDATMSESPACDDGGDLHKLVGSWITSKGPDEADVGQTSHWYDKCIVTGDARHLESRDSFDLEKLVTSIPSVFFPKALAERLARSLPLEPAAVVGSGESMPGASLGDIIQLMSGESRSGSRGDLRHTSANAFLRWRIARAAQPFTAPASESSAGMASQILPLPTVAAAASRGQARANWEADLSRRHAAMHQRKARRLAPPSGPSPISTRPVHTPAARRTVSLFERYCPSLGLQPFNPVNAADRAQSERQSMDPFAFFRRFFCNLASACPQTCTPSEIEGDVNAPEAYGTRQYGVGKAMRFGLGIAAIGWMCWTLFPML